MSYRPDIDGLRALAVLPVILFHFGFAGFSGGYVGVDVFFVISGYLITRLVVTEIERGDFSFTRFYERRARRLFPAMFVTAAACLVLSIFLLSNNNLHQNASATIFAMTSLSNVFFWSQSGYFDSDILSKPLLHTWSLSVEEQFYLFWPSLLLLLVPRFSPKWVVLAIVVLSIASLLAAEIAMPTYTSAAFYLTPFRVAEFAFGAVVVWLNRTWSAPNAVKEAILVTGIALIGWSVLTYTEQTAFPGLTSIPPCLGAALAIYAGDARFTGLVLRNPVARGIGLISYSLYLVHWPVAVFFDAYAFRDPELLEKFTMIACTFAIAAVMYRFVETPFRKPRGERRFSPPAFGLACALLTIALILPAALMLSNSRSDEAADDYADIGGQVTDSIGSAFTIFGNLIVATAAAAEPLIETANLFEERGTILREIDCPNNKPLCGAVSTSSVNAIILGDSHGTDAYNAFHTAFPDINFIVMKAHSCPPFGRIPNADKVEACTEFRKEWSDFLAANRDLPVVLQARVLPEDGPNDFAGYIRQLGSEGHTLIVVGMGAVYKRSALDYYDVSASEEMPRPDMSQIRDEEMYEYDAVLRAATEDVGGTFIDRHAFICPQGVCADYTRASDSLVVADKNHMTLSSAKEFGLFIADTYPNLFR